MAISLKILGKLIPLNGLDQISLQEVARIAERLDLKQGNQIFAIDSRDDYVYYLLKGEVALTDRNGRKALLTANSKQARFAFGTLKPRPSNARITSKEATLLRFVNNQLETLVAWDAQFSGSNSALSDDDDSTLLVAEMGLDEDNPIDSPWVMSLLCSPSFYDIPPENVQKVAQRMQAVAVKSGDTIIQQGEPGDYYYIIREGSAQVIRDGVTIAKLEPLTPFGEEALASGAPRNASIQMISDGLLMRLSKADFMKLLVPQLINRINVEDTKHLAKRGAVLLDVRSAEEFANRRLIRSVNIPLFLLRRRVRSLDTSRAYIVYCDSGIRSAAGCFLMAQWGYKVYLLNDIQQAFEELAAKPAV